MESVQVEAFATPVNAWIVRTPGRQFPGVVIQGDSLCVLFSLAQTVVEQTRAAANPNPVAAEAAEELRDLIWARLRQYEDVLREHDIRLPYTRDKWPL